MLYGALHNFSESNPIENNPNGLVRLPTSRKPRGDITAILYVTKRNKTQ